MQVHVCFAGEPFAANIAVELGQFGLILGRAEILFSLHLVADENLLLALLNSTDFPSFIR